MGEDDHAAVPDVEVTRILDAAWIALKGSGYENVKIQSVIRLSGVSVGTFYRHFASKDELLATMLDQELRRATAILDELTASGTPVERVRVWVDAIVSLAFGRNAGPRARWFTSLSAGLRLPQPPGQPGYPGERSPEADIMRPLREAIEAGVRDGSFPHAHPAPDARLIQALCSRLDELGVEFLGEDREATVDRVSNFVVAALSNPAPRLDH